MERLTKTYSDGTHGAADNLPCGENSYEYKGLLLEALGKYEDLEEVNARILTYDEAAMWDEYRKVGTPEECLRNKDFLDFLSDKMDPDDFEMYLHIYNSLDEKGNNNDGE